MTNVRSLHTPDKHGKPLDWLARGLEAALKNDSGSERLMITLDRAEAIDIVRMIDERNGDEGKTG